MVLKINYTSDKQAFGVRIYVPKESENRLVEKLAEFKNYTAQDGEKTSLIFANETLPEFVHRFTSNLFSKLMKNNANPISAEDKKVFYIDRFDVLSNGKSLLYSDRKTQNTIGNTPSKLNFEVRLNNGNSYNFSENYEKENPLNLCI